MEEEEEEGGGGKKKAEAEVKPGATLFTAPASVAAGVDCRDRREEVREKKKGETEAMSENGEKKMTA